jgi:hypothetical protein
VSYTQLQQGSKTMLIFVQVCRRSHPPSQGSQAQEQVSRG